MLFEDLQLSLLESLRARVKNGQVTERGLAKLVGVSQPHMHNVLKGTRILSSDLADRIMNQLHLSIFDLIDRSRLADFLATEQPVRTDCSYVPVLKGRLGPGHPWPATVDKHERMPMPVTQLSQIVSPVVAKLAKDIRMHPFSEGDFALLDQSLGARCTIDSEALYVIKRGNTGAVRRLRTFRRDLYIVTDDCIRTPAAWERIAVESQCVQHVVRARATLLPQDRDWWI